MFAFISYSTQIDVALDSTISKAKFLSTQPHNLSYKIIHFLVENKLKRLIDDVLVFPHIIIRFCDKNIKKHSRNIKGDVPTSNVLFFFQFNLKRFQISLLQSQITSIRLNYIYKTVDKVLIYKKEHNRIRIVDIIILQK